MQSFEFHVNMYAKGFGFQTPQAKVTFAFALFVFGAKPIMTHLVCQLKNEASK